MITSLIRKIVLLAALSLVAGCGSYSPGSTSGTTGMTSDCVNPSPINDAGLTDAQRNQLYQAAAAHGWQCYADWIQTLDPATLPYASLPHSGMQASYLPPDAQSLTQAKAEASLVIAGVVQSVSPLSKGFATDVTIAVTQVFKGQAGTSVVVRQGSHLEPRDNFQSIVIVDSLDAPLLLPGDNVFLLVKSTAVGNLAQLGFVGTYYVQNGLITPIPNNPFGAQVNGETVAAFTAALRSA